MSRLMSYYIPYIERINMWNKVLKYAESISDIDSRKKTIKILKNDR
jgi:hypothetical protein